MGATHDFRTYDTSDRESVRKQFEQACDSARRSDGTEYPGTIAALTTIVSWEDRKLASEAEAIAYLEDHHQKWQDAMAVSFHIAEEVTKEDKLKLDRAKKSVLSWQKRFDEALDEALVSFDESSCETVGCNNCGTRYPRKRLLDKFGPRTMPKCLLCGQNLLGKVALKRIEKLRERVRLSREKVDTLRQGKPSGEIGWVVGGWCPE